MKNKPGFSTGFENWKIIEISSFCSAPRISETARLDWGLALLLFLALTDLRHRPGMLLYARHCVYPLEFWWGNYVLNHCWTELKSILIDTTSNCAWYKKRCIQVTRIKFFSQNWNLYCLFTTEILNLGRKRRPSGLVLGSRAPPSTEIYVTQLATISRS